MQYLELRVAALIGDYCGRRGLNTSSKITLLPERKLMI